MINITEKARQEFHTARDANKISDNAMLRVNFGGMGWGGPNLYVTLDELQHDNDVVVEQDGVKVVYQPDLEQFLRNSTVDYLKFLFVKRFIIKGGVSSSC